MTAPGSIVADIRNGLPEAHTGITGSETILPDMNESCPEPAVTPHLVCKDAATIIDFCIQAFGARELHRLHGPDGKSIMHACLAIGNSRVMLVDENPQWGALSPASLGGTPVTIHLQLPDADATYAQALAAGAVSIMAPTDMFWGDRYGQVQDPSGHRWSLATHREILTPEQIAENARVLFSSGKVCSSES